MLTAFEQQWQQVPPGQRLQVARVERYDSSHGLFYMPASHIQMPVAFCPGELPDDEWIGKGFANLVKGEGSQPRYGRVPREISGDDGRMVPESLTSIYLKKCEDELVFGGLLDSILESTSLTEGGKIHALLSHPILGNPANRRNVSIEYIDKVAAAARSERVPLQLILPAFPFKDQNPFRTDAAPSHVDIAEAALLIRLHCLAIALNQVHPYDAQFIIVADGTVYADIFDIKRTDAINYQFRLRELRNQLNLEKTIQLLHLSDLLERDTVGREAARTPVRFDRIMTHIDERLRTLALEKRDLCLALTVLSRGIKWNLNLRPYLTKKNRSDLWLALTRARCRRTDSFFRLHRKISKQSVETAVRYAAFNLAGSWTELLARFFPRALRATVHPKEGQVGIPSLGKVYPWNGVGTVESLPLSAKSVVTRTLLDVARKRMQPHYLHGARFPFAYARAGAGLSEFAYADGSRRA